MRIIDQNLHVRFTSSMFVTEIKRNTEKKILKRKWQKKLKKLSEKCLCIWCKKIYVDDSVDHGKSRSKEQNQLQIKIHIRINKTKHYWWWSLAACRRYNYLCVWLNWTREHAMCRYETIPIENMNTVVWCISNRREEEIIILIMKLKLRNSSTIRGKTPILCFNEYITTSNITMEIFTVQKYIIL